MRSVLNAAGAAAVFGLAMVSSAPAAVITESIGGPVDYFAKTVTYNNDVVVAGRGTENGRDSGLNALGASDGDFFEIGLFDTVEFTFGTLFSGPGAVVEVTFGRLQGWPEFANFEVGYQGVFTLIDNNPISNQTPGAITLLFGSGPFDTIRVTNAAGTIVNNCGGNQCGGFDIDSIKVSAVPLPASVLLLLGALGGLGLCTRKGKAA
jgi:hypothetical protein